MNEPATPNLPRQPAVYERARRHAWMMVQALTFAIIFVVLIDRISGHSSIAFGIAIVGLVIANARMLTFNCPHCGKNLFFHGILVLPWPNAICGKCGADLKAEARSD